LVRQERAYAVEPCLACRRVPFRCQAEVVRSILESLAEAYRQTIDAAEALTGVSVETIHIVGGGSQNALLCRLTAQRTGRTVIAGPVEATAIGNLLIQARAVGEVSPDASLSDLRTIVRNSFPVVEYAPRSSGTGQSRAPTNAALI